MPNKPKTVELLLHEGTARKTKAEIKYREKAEKELRIGDQTFIITENVLNDQRAIRKWNELVKIYKGWKYVTDIDLNTIEKYCLLYSEYYQLLEIRKQLEKQYPDIIQLYTVLQEIKYDTTINKKYEILMKFEDRMFLNPLSRIRAVPMKKEEPKETYLESLGFGNV